ncbi:MAG: hypothetical protein Q9226_006473 [Calogaya cf. arnoldii]
MVQGKGPLFQQLVDVLDASPEIGETIIGNGVEAYVKPKFKHTQFDANMKVVKTRNAGGNFLPNCRALLSTPSQKPRLTVGNLPSETGNHQIGVWLEGLTTTTNPHNHQRTPVVTLIQCTQPDRAIFHILDLLHAPKTSHIQVTSPSSSSKRASTAEEWPTGKNLATDKECCKEGVKPIKSKLTDAWVQLLVKLKLKEEKMEKMEKMEKKNEKKLEMKKEKKMGMKMEMKMEMKKAKKMEMKKGKKKKEKKNRPRAEDQLRATVSCRHISSFQDVRPLHVHQPMRAYRRCPNTGTIRAHGLNSETRSMQSFKPKTPDIADESVPEESIVDKSWKFRLSSSIGELVSLIARAVSSPFNLRINEDNNDASPSAQPPSASVILQAADNAGSTILDIHAALSTARMKNY